MKTRLIMLIAVSLTLSLSAVAQEGNSIQDVCLWQSNTIKQQRLCDLQPPKAKVYKSKRVKRLVKNDRVV